MGFLPFYRIKNLTLCQSKPGELKIFEANSQLISFYIYLFFSFSFFLYFFFVCLSVIIKKKRSERNEAGFERALLNRRAYCRDNTNR